MTFSDRKFFDACRAGIMGPTLDDDEVSGCNAILAAMNQLPLAWTSKALGTAHLETAHTMQPVKEANWLSDAAANRYFFRMYDIQGQRPKVARVLGNLQPGDGVRFCGRGYPQMTGRNNYQKADNKLSAAGLIQPGELMANPDLAMRPDIAAYIMRYGMREGWFTGKSFQSYLPASGPGTRQQFKDARRIINGQDRAGDVAEYSLKFQAALIAGGWEW